MVGGAGVDVDGVGILVHVTLGGHLHGRKLPVLQGIPHMQGLILSHVLNGVQRIGAVTDGGRAYFAHIPEAPGTVLQSPHGAIPGKTQSTTTNYYNLDAIISVGYRVNSIQATQFRIWATNILKEYMVKGFVMDDDRLKLAKTAFGKDYFRELLERVRSIRASERRIWQQITDIFAECSIDYSPNSEITQKFYATVQNKFHYAITGKTAAEIIYESADHTKEHMGLTTWKNAPDGRILKSDTSVAKNYLSEKEIKQLERTVTGYFDYIEDLVERENAFTMQEFSDSINAFLEFRRYEILKDNGCISQRQAQEKAHLEYAIYNKNQPIESDFDKVVKRISQQ